MPLIVPITLIHHYVRKYYQPYLKQQVYLNPYSFELQLRNQVEKIEYLPIFFINLLTYNSLQGLLNLRILKGEPATHKPFWNHPLTFQNDGPKFSKYQFYHKPRSGH